MMFKHCKHKPSKSQEDFEEPTGKPIIKVEGFVSKEKEQCNVHQKESQEKLIMNAHKVNEFALDFVDQLIEVVNKKHKKGIGNSTDENNK